MKLKNAAHMTAYCGRSTRVETMVAIELAASCRPLRKVEEQRDCNEGDEQRQGERRVHQTFSITMPLISLATSSKRSTTFSSSP